MQYLQKRRYRRFTFLLATTLLVLILSYIPIRLTLASFHSPTPEAILTLGGRPSREAFTAELAKENPYIPIWISTGLAPVDVIRIFQDANVPLHRLNLNYRAVDTLTNFTTLVDEFQRLKIHHVYLVTSHFHMRRAKAIAFFVFGSRGIFCTCIAAPSGDISESWLKTLRDIVRSILWMLTGITGHAES